MKKNSKSKSNNKKYLIVGFSLVLIFVILLSTKLNPIRLLSSLYNADKIESNIDKIKIGDHINYEINGYSDWQVVSIDKNNNTLDVVSRKNVEDVSLTTKEDYENALDIFQEVANKYTDDKYVIKTRCVNRADLDNFAFDEVFWNADIYNGYVAFTNGAVKYGGTDDIATLYSFLPYVRYHFDESVSGYNAGDEVDLNIAGIDKWIFAEKPYDWYDSALIIPATPIDINISDENVIDNLDIYFDSFYQELRDASPNVREVGNYIYTYGYDTFLYGEGLRDHYSSILNKYSFINGVPDIKQEENYIKVGFSAYIVDYESNNVDSKWIDYKKPIPYTKGFRPIVTLKYSDKLVDGNNLDIDLQIGDNVNYSANEYNNWRVLSIDEENGTVDIISGGIVKNLKLYGIDDFDNYDEMMQQEVDAYKVGDNAISARIVQYNDLVNLNKMNDMVNVKYWTYETNDYNKKANDDTSSPYATNAYYDASIMYYDVNEAMIQRKWVSLYISSGMSSGGNTILSSDNGMGDLSFTAGIRPVITLKLENVQKISDDDKTNIIDNENEQQQKIDNEQKNNDEKYIKNDSTNDVINNYTIIKKNNNIDNKDNIDKQDDENKNEEVNNYYHNINKEGSKNKLVKYIIIAIMVLNVAILGQIVLSVFIIKNIKNVKRRKK